MLIGCFSLSMCLIFPALLLMLEWVLLITPIEKVLSKLTKHARVTLLEIILVSILWTLNRFYLGIWYRIVSQFDFKHCFLCNRNSQDFQYFLSVTPNKEKSSLTGKIFLCFSVKHHELINMSFKGKNDDTGCFNWLQKRDKCRFQMG